MKRVNGNVFLPDDEQDQVMLGAGSNYQSNKLQPALKYLKKARTAIDVGAHCGLWTVQLAQYFETVEAFEPLPRHSECWRRNAGWKETNRLHEVALGAKDGMCGLHIVEGFSGRSHINGGGDVQMKLLDDYAFENVDLIKVDVEGYEYFVLKGAERTITRWKPVLIVEQKENFGSRYGLGDRSAVEYLQSLGAVLKEEIFGDFILAWDV